MNLHTPSAAPVPDPRGLASAMDARGIPVEAVPLSAHIRPALVMVALMTALTGIAYPLAITGIAGVIAPEAASGSLEREGDRVVGSRLIGQAFATDRYFHGRPSTAGEAGYDASASSGSNLGPTSAKLVERVKRDVTAFRATNGLTAPTTSTAVPADAVTASGSGLDPHVSPATALVQVDRVAHARGLDPARVRGLVDAMTRGRVLGLFGEPRVDVLLLNRALDRL